MTSKPIFAILFGTPGAGKSSVFEAYRKHYLKHEGVFVRNDTDAYVYSNMEYQTAARAILDKNEGYNATVQQLQDLFMKHARNARAKRFADLKELIQAKTNIVIDITKVNTLKSIIPTIAKQDYHVHIVCPYVGDIAKLTTRIHKRFHDIGQVPVPTEQIAELMQTIFEGLISIIHMCKDRIDRISIIDNNDDVMLTNANLKKRMIFSYDAHSKECHFYHSVERDCNIHDANIQNAIRVLSSTPHETST